MNRMCFCIECEIEYPRPEPEPESEPESEPEKVIWKVRYVAGYYRVMRNGKIIATYTQRGPALAGMIVEKRRKANARKRAKGRNEST